MLYIPSIAGVLSRDDATLCVNGAAVGTAPFVYTPPASHSAYIGIGGFVGRVCDIALYDHCVTVSALSQHYSAAVATATATIGLDVPSSVAAALAAITPTSASAGDEEGVAGSTACCSASGVLGDVVASSGRDRSPVADPSEDVSVPADVAALSILSKLDDLVAGWVLLLSCAHPNVVWLFLYSGRFFPYAYVSFHKLHRSAGYP